MQFSFIVSIFIVDKKSLKIPKGQSESEHRRTDNIMTKRIWNVYNEFLNQRMCA